MPHFTPVPLVSRAAARLNSGSFSYAFSDSLGLMDWVFTPTIHAVVDSTNQISTSGIDVQVSGFINVGNATGGDGALTLAVESGSLNTAARSFAVNVSHAGGWTPLRDVDMPFGSVFITPPFGGYLQVGPGSYVRLDAEAKYPEPLNLTADSRLSLLGDPLSDRAELGPSLSVSYERSSSAAAPVAYAVSTAGSLRIGRGDRIPDLMMSADIDSSATGSGQLAMSVAMAGAFVPLPNAAPGLIFERFAGSCTLVADGSLFLRASALAPNVSVSQTLAFTNLDATLALDFQFDSGDSSEPNSDFDVALAISGNVLLSGGDGLEGSAFEGSASGSVVLSSDGPAKNLLNVTVSHPGGWSPCEAISALVTPPVSAGFVLGPYGFVSFDARVAYDDAIPLPGGRLTLIAAPDTDNSGVALYLALGRASSATTAGQIDFNVTLDAGLQIGPAEPGANASDAVLPILSINGRLSRSATSYLVRSLRSNLAYSSFPARLLRFPAAACIRHAHPVHAILPTLPPRVSRSLRGLPPCPF